jgi:hypothetical protein
MRVRFVSTGVLQVRWCGNLSILGVPVTHLVDAYVGVRPHSSPKCP